MLNMFRMLLSGMTGDDSRPWLIAVCLIISIAIMIFLFVIGREDDEKNDKEKKK